MSNNYLYRVQVLVYLGMRTFSQKGSHYIMLGLKMIFDLNNSNSSPLQIAFVALIIRYLLKQCHIICC